MKSTKEIKLKKEDLKDLYGAFVVYYGCRYGLWFLDTDYI